MAPVPAGQALYHLRAICMKNSKALFSSLHPHPHCPTALVTQTITPSPQAPPWPGGGDPGSRTQGFTPCQAQEVELEAHLWRWKKRGSESLKMVKGPHSLSEGKLNEKPLSPPSQEISQSPAPPNSGATESKPRCFRFNLAPMRLPLASGFPKGKQEVQPWRRPTLLDLYPPREGNTVNL